jgi:hypothetical protein
LLSNLAFLLIVPGYLHAQELGGLSTGQILSMPKNPLDSVQHSFYSKADSFKQQYHQKLSRIDSSKTRLQSKIDSLTSLRLPTGKYTAKLDSLNQKREKLVGSLNDKIGELKSKTLGKINNLQLPPELSEKVSSVTQNIEGFKLPVKDLNIPSLDLPDNVLGELNGLNTSIDLPLRKIEEIDGFKDVTDQS